MNVQPNREVALFSAALELPAAQRAAYLDQACADDPALRQRLEELLRVHEDAITFLENNLPGAQVTPPGAALSDADVPVPSSPAEKAGDRIGRYKLLQQIGEGGCGIVYMAEQEEPVRRRVALKVIKLGMDTKQVIARFQAERQALALMDHSNIAQVFDAGSTDNGRPYFVMELVRGIKITDYCDQNNLSTTERLNLFMQVCHAIQHAHQKGIIHRDIKPSNILVASNDGVPVPKVIDFGIAKATQGRLTDQTVFTAFEQFIGTPAYMSPEQAELTMLDIDTRTDIYSLGVLLYELLTGKTPFDQKELIAAGLDEMRRTIREKEPLRPSTRLSTMAEGDQTTAAKHRHTDAPKLIHLLRGDLDWIVMKALEKDRARRYETASGLANDVKRHLNCEPVVARPPSKLYEFQKTVRRHKLGFGAAAALILVLTAGVLVSASQAFRATRAERQQSQLRQQAELAEKKATEELWHAYVAQARAARFSGQPGRRFDSLEALSKAAAIRFDPQLRDEAISCLALPDLKPRHHIEVNGVFDCALERYAFVLTNTGEVSIRSASDERELLRLPPLAGAGHAIYPGKFSHNGKFLPVWYNDQSLRVWDLEARATVLTAPVALQWDSVDFQRDDARLAVAGPGKVDLFPLATGQRSEWLTTPFDASCVRFDPSGRKLAISSPQDRRVPIIDCDSGAVLLVLTNSEGLNEIAWHPNSPILAGAAGQSGRIYLWDTATGRQLFALRGHQSSASNVAFSHNGDILISSGWDGTHLWHVRTGEHLMLCLNYGCGESFGPDDGTYGQTMYLGQGLELLSFAPGREARRWHDAEENHDHKHIAFSPDGRWLASAAGGFVELFDARTTDLIGTLSAGPVHGLVFQKNGGGLLVSGDRGLFRWPVRPGSSADEFSVGPAESFGSPGAWQQSALSENGRVFAAFRGDRVCLFDGNSLREMGWTGACGRPPYRYISLSPDGSKLATGGWHEEVVQIWDAQTGGAITNLSRPEWSPQGSPFPVFAPTGLIIGCWWNYRVWDTDSWTAGPPRQRSGLPIVALSHQGALLAICDEAQTSIQLRDIASGEVLGRLQSSSPNHIADLAFSPDDTQIAVVFEHTRELTVWDLRLLRDELRAMGMDWARPPYPPVTDEPGRKTVHLRVRTNSLPQAVRAGEFGFGHLR